MTVRAKKNGRGKKKRGRNRKEEEGGAKGGGGGGKAGGEGSAMRDKYRFFPVAEIKTKTKRNRVQCRWQASMQKENLLTKHQHALGAWRIFMDFQDLLTQSCMFFHLFVNGENLKIDYPCITLECFCIPEPLIARLIFFDFNVFGGPPPGEHIGAKSVELMNKTRFVDPFGFPGGQNPIGILSGL